ncbi:DsbA family oxidoreductase [Peribacillus kribbensis]|uniref:DsbA family oxidoreductase n=1 Tax=Peribacillus kribbensis TaxID=356658 RepID=UPI0003FDCF79|nr:DsbA family oxidoreductase [Peribacillus kribbensis]
MKIEVWSDFVCPFCYIGKRRLEQALVDFPYSDSVEVEFKSFELDPNAEKYMGRSIHETLAAKYGMTVEQAKEANAGVGRQAESVGLTYHFEGMKPTNTFDAHRLAKFAKSKGKEAEVTEKLLFAYFTESRDLGDAEVLADIAESAGLDREEAAGALNDPAAFRNDVRIDEALAQQYGVTGVPFFVINQKYAISGAQPKETFDNALLKVWQEENPAVKLQDLSGSDALDASCTDDSCSVPKD